MRDIKRYWYFVTEEDMGDQMSLTPRCPINMGDDEPTLKRICVAPTPAHCMSAINIYQNIVHVYRTVRPVKGHKPYSVGDSRITKEHWLKTKTRFERVTALDVTKSNWGRGSRGGSMEHYHSEQRTDKKRIFSGMWKRDPRLCTIQRADTRWKPKIKWVSPQFIPHPVTTFAEFNASKFDGEVVVLTPELMKNVTFVNSNN